METLLLVDYKGKFFTIFFAKSDSAPIWSDKDLLLYYWTGDNSGLVELVARCRWEQHLHQNSLNNLKNMKMLLGTQLIIRLIIVKFAKNVFF